MFGRKKLFFTVLYRNPENRSNSPEFDIFLKNFETTHARISESNPYAMFFTGDINGHTQAWYADGDTNAEGTKLNDLFTNLGLSQLITEPTHYLEMTATPLV